MELTRDQISQLRMELIGGVQKAARCEQAAAHSASLTAVRKGDKDSLADARLWVARNDAREAMAEEVINLIRRYWPDSNLFPESEPVLDPEA